MMAFWQQREKPCQVRELSSIPPEGNQFLAVQGGDLGRPAFGRDVLSKLRVASNRHTETLFGFATSAHHVPLAVNSLLLSTTLYKCQANECFFCLERSQVWNGLDRNWFPSRDKTLQRRAAR